jgi:hypothetical protein
MEQLLDDHRNNRKSKFCESCWKIEESGIKSKRQAYNESYGMQGSLTERSVNMAVIPVGNVCNLYCVTCNPMLSTSWFKKHQSMHTNNYKGKAITDIKVSDIKDIGQLKHIEFIGGETLKSPSLWQYLTTLDREKSFSLQTNGTVELTDKQIELLKSFKNFNICFSIDGHGKIFEYMRQPAKWNFLTENIKKYIKNFGIDRLSTHITIGNLNIFYVDEIVLNIFKLVPSKLDINLVNNPTEFAYDNLDEQTGELVEKNNPVFFKKYKAKWIGNPQSLARTLDNLKKQDAFSGLKFEDHLPEVFSLLLR